MPFIEDLNFNRFHERPLPAGVARVDENESNAQQIYADNGIPIDKVNGLEGLTATVDELNILTNTTVTATELEYLSGTTSNIQAQLDAKADGTISLTAGETISGATTPQVVRLSDGNPKNKTLLCTTQRNVGTVVAVYGVNWYAQSFTNGTGTPTITGGTLNCDKAGVPADDLTVALYAVDGAFKPTGAALATCDILSANLVTSTEGDIRFTFGTPYTLTASTQYALVFSSPSSTAAANSPRVGISSTSKLTGGNRLTSTDSGATWTLNSTSDVCFELSGYYAETADRVYKAYADDITSLDLIGLAITTATSGNTITVQTDGVVSGFTGLTTDADYYLQNDGTLSTNIGAYNIKIGKAISTTQIHFNYTKPSLIELASAHKNRLYYSEPIGVASSSVASLAATNLNNWVVEGSYTTECNNNNFYFQGNGASGSDDFFLRWKPLDVNHGGDELGSMPVLGIEDYFEMGCNVIPQISGSSASVASYYFIGWSQRKPSDTDPTTETVWWKHCMFIIKVIPIDASNRTVTAWASVSDGHTQNKTVITGVADLVECNLRVKCDGRTAKFYVDGVLKATLTANLPVGETDVETLSLYKYGPMFYLANDSGTSNVSTLFANDVYAYTRIFDPTNANFADNFLTH